MTQTDSSYKILFLRLDPGQGEHRVQQDKELNKIYAAISGERVKCRFSLIDSEKVELKELVNIIRDEKPHIIHLSGHGSQDKLRFSDFYSLILKGEATKTFDLASEALQNILGDQAIKPRLLFINACYAAEIAEALNDVFDCTIGMSNPLDQDLALELARRFYTEIVRGETVKSAFSALPGLIEALKIQKGGQGQGFDPQPQISNEDLSFPANGEEEEIFKAVQKSKEQPDEQEIINQTQTNMVSSVNVSGNFEFKPIQEGKKTRNVN